MDALDATARGIGGLLAVLALVWILSRVARARLGPGSPTTLRVRHRVPLGRRSAVAVVEAGSRTILVGIGDAQVTFLADLEGWDAPNATAAGDVVVRRAPDPGTLRHPARGTGPGGLRDLVGRIQERTVRR